MAHDLWEDDDSGTISSGPRSAASRARRRLGEPPGVVKTGPCEQWAVAREMRQRIKARFDQEGIEIPFAQRVVWHRDAQPRREDAADASGE